MATKLSFCLTCIHEKGSCEAMNEPDARIHKDNNPTHNIVSPDQEHETETKTETANA